MRRGFLIAAPHSGSGKTVISLALMRALADAGDVVQPHKAGPDFIDPAFHAVAARTECFNLDPWAMRPGLIGSLSNREGLTIVEGMMGLFDGAADGSGSAADLAVLLNLPVVLVVDCSRQSHSVAALVRGFRDHQADVRIAALILNKVATPRHEKLLRDALEPLGIPVAGIVPPSHDLNIPERHLGLVQAVEHGALETFIENAATMIKANVDLNLLKTLNAREPRQTGSTRTIAPLGQRISIAHDDAFAFTYPHLLNDWRCAGAELSFFSPLANEAPDETADFVFLPGGYPELHTGKIAAASRFLDGIRAAQVRGAVIYGECGGFMVLGEGLTDADGVTHRMSSLLPVQTSFTKRMRHLGYRKLVGGKETLFPGKYRAHEFHYSTLVHQGEGIPLFEAKDALGADLGIHGIQIGKVAGSYMHLIDLDKIDD